MTLLAGEFLKQVKPYIDEGVHPQIIIRSFRKALFLVRKLYIFVLSVFRHYLVKQ